MTSWTVAQLGARMHYAVPRILHEAGILDRFYTDICAAKGWPHFVLIGLAFKFCTHKERQISRGAKQSVKQSSPEEIARAIERE
jgi:hypothetical protein